MNGMKPNFLVAEPKPEYYTAPDPYKSHPSCNVNLLELSRYAKKTGKKLVQLSAEEVKRFAL